jgi:hypothetical protein
MLVEVPSARRERVDPHGEAQENEDPSAPKVLALLAIRVCGVAILAPIVPGDLHLHECRLAAGRSQLRCRRYLLRSCSLVDPQTSKVANLCVLLKKRVHSPAR